MCSTMFTCGDIFPDASDRNGCTFYPISISILNYSLYPSMDLYRDNRKPYYFLICQVLLLEVRGFRPTTCAVCIVSMLIGAHSNSFLAFKTCWIDMLYLQSQPDKWLTFHTVNSFVVSLFQCWKASLRLTDSIKLSRASLFLFHSGYSSTSAGNLSQPSSTVISRQLVCR